MEARGRSQSGGRSVPANAPIVAKVHKVDSRPASDHLNVRETAKHLGVHENTVRNWAEQGVLPSVRLPGSNYRRFDPREVDRVAEAMRERTNQPGASSPGMRTELVDATYLHGWGGRREAQDRLPRIVRRLLAATPGVSDLAMPAGEGIASPGWDGRVTCVSEHPFVPPGQSRWEIGTGDRPAAKAQSDFAKRTKDPGDAVPAETTFVFVTPRRWRDARKWESERRADGVWRDVRVIDADDLEGWLESVPAVHFWVSEELGLHPRRARSLGEWWNRFSARTGPRLPSGLLLAGREQAAGELHAFLREPAAAKGVRASSRDEATAFIAAALAADAPGGGPADHPRVVVYDGGVWERLARTGLPAVLVPSFADPDIAMAVEGGHHVLVPLGAGDLGRGDLLELRRLDRTEAREALELVGIPFERSDQLAALARRSFKSMLRSLATDPRLERPDWARSEHGKMLAPLVLVTKWSNIDPDLVAVAELSGREWPELERKLRVLSAHDDPPFAVSAGEWRLTSPEEAWEILHPALTSEDLQGFRRLAERVLGETDPSLEVPDDERPFAALRGVAREYSDALREGVAQGLALLGARGDHPLAGGGTGRDQARALVRSLLERANADLSGHLWRSLATELPLLAEAAPEEFLDAVAEGSAGEDPLLRTMFRDAEGTSLFFSSSPHTGLLWALEKLCWSPDYIIRAASMLARLAEIDPGGRLSNRPTASLRTVFLPWVPRTQASVERRTAVIDCLRERHPTVAWELMLALLPRNHDSSGPTSRPRFRDWMPEREGVLVTEWVEAIASLVDRAIEDAANDPQRLAELAGHAAPLPPDQLEVILERFEAVEPSSLDEQGRLVLWRKLQEIVAHHREFPSAEWSMDDPPLRRMEAVADKLEPRAAVERHAHLFGWRPRLGGVARSDHDAYEKALEAARADALRDTLSAAGLDGITALAEASEVPGHVGWTMAEVAGEEIASELLPFLERDGKVRELASAWARRMALLHGPAWLEPVTRDFETWPADRQAMFLLAVPLGPQTWALLERLGEETRKRFWHSLSPWGVPPENVELVAEKLLQHGRAWPAIDLLAGHCRTDDEKREVTPSVELVDQVLRAALRVESVEEIRAGAAGYEVGVLLDYLEARGADAQTLGELEWAFFPILDDTREPRALYAALNESPQLFVELVSLVYRGKSEQPRDLDERSKQLASHAWSVLHEWRRVPGHREENHIDAEHLRAWVRDARLLLADRDRADIGDEQLGQLLSGSPNGSDGAWPAEPIRDLIEDLGSKELEIGFHLGVVNSRGVTSRGVYDGGDQERALAARYREWATAVEAWPRTSRLLRELVDDYERDARREDERAERDANDG